MLLAKLNISGHSMEPNIKDGETVLVSNLFYLFQTPKIGDIVAFRYKKDQILIKRIVKISEKGYLVKGDNIKDSLDSRSFGYISKNKIIGKIIKM